VSRSTLAATARSLRDQGLNPYEIASELGYSYCYVNELLRDPEGLERKRRYWRERTPLQKAISRIVMEDAKVQRTFAP
jgi:predicted transcriptional regulator